MNDDKLFRYGLVGTVAAMLCCFTPVLVVALGAVGLSGLVGWLDYVLFPILGASIAVTIYAYRRRRSP